MIDWMFHTFWGGVATAEFAHVIGVLFFLQLVRG
jgi:hypothetical protein